jgi:hypothetical protein
MISLIDENIFPTSTMNSGQSPMHGRVRKAVR